MENQLFRPAGIAFILIIATTCAGFLLGKLDPALFMGIVSAATTFFFVKPPTNGTNGTNSDIETSGGDGK